MDRTAQQPALSGERGIALVLAVFALVVVGLLVATAFIAGTEEQRMAENSRRLERALGVAEAGAYELLRGTYPLDSSPVGWTRAPGGTGAYSGSVYRLSPDLFLLDIVGSDTPGGPRRGARQRIGLLARLRPVQMGCRLPDSARLGQGDPRAVDSVRDRKCLSDSMLRSTVSLRPLRSRGWAHLF